PGGDPMAAIGGVPGVAGGQAGGMPSDLRGRLIWRFEHKLMPFFYNLNMKHEWRVVGIGLAAFFVLANLVISGEPILNSSTKASIQETKRRAGTMARVLVTQNTPAIAQGAETKTTIESVERERGVRVAVITDLESRIIAPASRMNQ